MFPPCFTCLYVFPYVWLPGKTILIPLKFPWKLILRQFSASSTKEKSWGEIGCGVNFRGKGVKSSMNYAKTHILPESETSECHKQKSHNYIFIKLINYNLLLQILIAYSWLLLMGNWGKNKVNNFSSLWSKFNVVMVDSCLSVPHKSNGILKVLAAKYTFVLCQTTQRTERKPGYVRAALFSCPKWNLAID